MQDLVVIGGGPAGVTAALRARELGAAVTLVERDRLGGTCTNDGCVPTRVLAKAARLARDAAQFEPFGLVGQAPVVDLPRLLSRAQGIVYTIHEKKQLLQHLEEVGALVLTGVGDARFVNEHTLHLQNGAELNAEKYILCVGGHARRPNFPGAELALTLSDIWSLKKQPASLAIVGGAATGCQLASVFNAFGTHVALLELNKRLLFLEDQDVSRAIQSAFRDRGIQLLTGIRGIERIEARGNRMDLYFLQDEGTTRLEVEAVAVAIGWPGNVEALNLEAAGVQVQRGYVVVDDYLRTTADNIFAAGDITGRMGLVQSAVYEAQVAVENALLGIGQRQRHVIVPHGGFTDPEYGSVGMTEEQARTLEDVITAVVPYLDLDRAVIDGHTDGLGKLIVSRETHRILGAQVVGEQALEIVQLVAAGMAADMRVEQLAELEIAYPTYTAVVGLAARRIVTALGERPLAPEWRALGKTHAAEWESRSD